MGRFEIEWREEGATVDFYGEILITGVQGALGALYKDHRFYHAAFRLFDFSRADLSGIALGDMAIPAAYDFGASRTVRCLRVSIVAIEWSSETLWTEYIRISRDLDSHWDFSVFREREMALDWCIGNPAYEGGK